MRRVRYAVAVSLDGDIAGPRGETDWIEMDPSVDAATFFKESTSSDMHETWWVRCGHG